MWGASPGSYWAGGRSGYVVHYDGGEWANVARPGNIRAIWGSSDQDIWAIGRANDTAMDWSGGSDIFHAQGTSWVQQPSPTSNTLFAVHGSSGHNVWAAGTAGTLLHSDGGSWQVDQPRQAVTAQKLNAVWANASVVWAAADNGDLLFNSGSGWQMTHALIGQITSMSGTAADNLWIAGPNGAEQLTSAGWIVQNGGVDAGFASIWTPGPGEAWALSNDGFVYRFSNATKWSQVHAVSTNTVLFDDKAIWGSGPNDVYAMSIIDMQHWDGGAWGGAPGPVTESPKQGVFAWGSGPDDVYVDIGNTWINHWDGNHWNPPNALRNMMVTRIAGTGRDDVWLVGTQVGSYVDRSGPPLAWHYDGQQWTSMPMPLEDLRGVAIIDPHHVVVVGSDGQVLVKTY
jgi:hypothetical protein